MKIAVVTDQNGNFVPLDFGERIAIINTEEKKIYEYKNPGYNKPNGGKEIAMASILRLQPDAFVAVPGAMCPGSYRMSINRVKYMMTESSNLTDLLQTLDEHIAQNIVDELPMEVYKEEY